jgi:hypothetical protein
MFYHDETGKKNQTMENYLLLCDKCHHIFFYDIITVTVPVTVFSPPLRTVTQRYTNPTDTDCRC